MDAVKRLEAWRGRRSFVVASRELECDPSHLFRILKRAGRPGIDVRRKIENIVGIPFDDWDAVKITKSRAIRRAS